MLRLSHSTVSLLDINGNVVETHDIEDATRKISLDRKTKNRNQWWSFGDDGQIKNQQCNTFITVGGASARGTRTTMSLVRQLVRTTTANNTQGDAIKIHDDIGYSPRQYTASDNFTTQVSWKNSSPPRVGLPIVLSAECAQ